MSYLPDLPKPSDVIAAMSAVIELNPIIAVIGIYIILLLYRKLVSDY
ncbi:hypothetical protein ABLO26_03620 [Neobacillus sp. 179-J 1A1 HS]